MYSANSARIAENVPAKIVTLRYIFSLLQVSYVRNTQKEQDEELNRLTQEVTMLGRLNHPNVVRCLGATQHDGHINVFVEWMAGGWVELDSIM